jgi:signal transduction histidine kinase
VQAVRHPILWLRARPRLTDAAIAIALAGMAVTSHLLVHKANGQTFARPTVLSVVLCLLATLPLYRRRHDPVVVLNVVVLAQLALELLRTNGPGWSGVIVAAYSLGAYDERQRLVSMAAWFVAEIASVGVGGAIFGAGTWPDVIAGVALVIAAIALGSNVAMRRHRLAELAERAERAERERGLLATQRVQEERTLIARELHDAVAHSVSVMVIQAGAARRQLAADPERANQALEVIESTGRQAMVEMRRILGVLRQHDVPAGAAVELAPAPSLAQLPDLVRADPDLPVELHEEGVFDDVPPSIEVHVYRLVQEALTNVRRHAGVVGKVDVTVARRDDSIDVEVDDDGRGAITLLGNGAAADGHGLVGMRERVAASGGELLAGPRPGGGWRVRAVFPLPGRASALSATGGLSTS